MTQSQPEFILKTNKELVAGLDDWYAEKVQVSTPKKRKKSVYQVQQDILVDLPMKPIMEVSLLQSGLLDSSILELEEILALDIKKPVAFASFRKAQRKERQKESKKPAKTSILQKLKNVRTYVRQEKMSEDSPLNGKPNIKIKEVISEVQDYFEKYPIFNLDKIERAQ